MTICDEASLAEMIRELSGKGDDASGAPRKRRRSSGSKRKRAGAPSASGE